MVRVIGLVVLFCASLLAAGVQRESASPGTAPDGPGVGQCLHGGTESAGDPRSGSIPAEHASAILGGPHWTGPGGHADPVAGRLLQTFRGQPAVRPPDARRPHLSGRPLHIPLLI